MPGSGRNQPWSRKSRITQRAYSNGCCEISWLCPLQTQSSFSLLPSLVNQAPPSRFIKKLRGGVCWPLSSSRGSPASSVTAPRGSFPLPLTPKPHPNPCTPSSHLSQSLSRSQMGSWVGSVEGFPGNLNPSYSKTHTHLLCTYYMQNIVYTSTVRIAI